MILAGQADSIEHPVAPKSDAEGRELRYRAFQKRPLLGDVWQVGAYTISDQSIEHMGTSSRIEHMGTI
jgi:hypothetical protein